MAAALRAGIEGSFAHWEAVPDLDFAAAFDVSVMEMMESPNRLVYDVVVQRLLALLRNGHTTFRDRWLETGPGRPFGVALRPLGGRWTVTRSVRDQLPVGSVVTAVDGQTITDALAERRRFLCASSDRAAEMALFRNTQLFPDEIVLRTESGAEVRLDKGDHPAPWPGFPTIAPARGCSLLRLRSFSDEMYESTALSELDGLDSDAPLLIDLRGNGGGNTPLGLLERLMDRPYRLWRSSVSETNSLARAHEQPPAIVTFPSKLNEPALRAHKGRIVLVVDATVGSAAEDFVMPFKDNGRALIVGETTSGSSGQPHLLFLGEEMTARIGAKRESFPDGSPFEGIGIVPDLAVDTTPEDLAAGRDPALLAAIEAIA